MAEVDPQRTERGDAAQCLVMLLKRLGCPAPQIARELGLTPQGVEAWGSGVSVPPPERLAALVAYAGRYVHDALALMGFFLEIGTAPAVSGTELGNATRAVFTAATARLHTLTANVAAVVGEGTPNADQLELQLAGERRRAEVLGAALSRSKRPAPMSETGPRRALNSAISSGKSEG